MPRRLYACPEVEYTEDMRLGPRLLLSVLLAASLRLPAGPPAAAQALEPARGQDKVLHFLAGASSALLASAVAAPALQDAPLPDTRYALAVSGIGLGAAVCAGAGKELLDMTGFGDPDWRDLLATVAGGLAASAVVLAASSSERQASLGAVYLSFGVVLALPPAATLFRILSSRRSSASSE